ncbi:MAG: MMPL family transporter, partial [Proteobacteria bacterium]|nr:MMPL family transporter [Pseudomonadota bacterium]
ATLTLPGIAGIVLTIGMAVDANVLVFERIREEVRGGRGPVTAIDAGYRRALTTIIDSNVTTLIAALLLLVFGTGPVRGFAVTLSIGIVTSMFTAIMLTRLLIVVWLRRKRPQALAI